MAQAETDVEKPESAVRHHVRIRYAVTCDQCGDIGEVTTIGEGVALADQHEAVMAGAAREVAG